MPSTFSPNKNYELQATGENTNTWGVILNSVLSIIDLNFGGRQPKNVAGAANVTITSAEARNFLQNLTGLLTGNIDYIVPNTGSFYFVVNGTTGAFNITVKPSGGTGVVVPQGTSALLFADPTLGGMRAIAMLASETIAGFSEKAAAAEANAQTSTVTHLSPSNLAERASFSANKNASSQACNGGATAKVTFTTEVWDIGTLYNTTDSRWVPPAGYARISFGASYTVLDVGADTTITFMLYKNGALFRTLTRTFNPTPYTTTGVHQMNATAFVNCNGTDYFEIFMTTVGGGPGSAISGTVTDTYFQGEVI